MKIVLFLVIVHVVVLVFGWVFGGIGVEVVEVDYVFGVVLVVLVRVAAVVVVVACLIKVKGV